MRVLLKGGPWNNRIIGLPNWKVELLVPIPEEVTAAFIEDNYSVPNLKVGRYIPSRMRGYGPYDDEYSIWVYDGEE